MIALAARGAVPPRSLLHHWYFTHIQSLVHHSYAWWVRFPSRLSRDGDNKGVFGGLIAPADFDVNVSPCRVGHDIKWPWVVARVKLGLLLALFPRAFTVIPLPWAFAPSIPRIPGTKKQVRGVRDISTRCESRTIVPVL
jgi:hypothetical protein